MKPKLQIRILQIQVFLAVLLAWAGGTCGGQIPDLADIEGGFIVHAGCGNGKETAALRTNKNCTVQGLDRSFEKVKAAREYLLSKGLYGSISVRVYPGNALPYNDNLVNILVIEDTEDIATGEVMRALVPGGRAFIEKEDGWKKLLKPVPDGIDEWTHSLYDAACNAVSNDTVVGPPKHLQWYGRPRFGRQHEHMSSISAVVTAGGRIFSIVDEGSTFSILLPSRWKLVARDAYNGVVLWKRPIENWHCRWFPMKNGPSVLGHRIVAAKERVYVTPGREAPITSLDARTGKTVLKYTQTANTHTFVLEGGVLYAVCSEPGEPVLDYERKKKSPVPERNRLFKTGYEKGPRTINAVDAETGKLLWRKPTRVQKLSLAVYGENLVLHNDRGIVCLDRSSGKERWKSEPVHPGRVYPFGRGATLVVYDNVVLFSAFKGDVTAFSLEDGKTLWHAPQPGTGHRSAQDIFVIDGLVWYGQTASGHRKGTFWGRDPHTGEVKKKFDPDQDVYWFHHRCHRARATRKYIITSRTGTEFVDFRNETWNVNHWVRGACAYGIVPANGMLYAPTHPCACYLSAKLQFFNALAPGSRTERKEKRETPARRLEKGQAYNEKVTSNASPGDWPQYRCDEARSGYTEAALKPDLKPAWKASLGGRLTRLVASEGKVFVGAVDRHTLYALNSQNGDSCWHYTTGGRIDSPPACINGRVLFGSAGGFVYCLKAADGRLIWRYRAAPGRRQMMALGQPESAWPVHGSVLVQNGKVYATAGRIRFLDGGIRLLVLDVETGEKISETVLDKSGPDGKNLHSKVHGLSMPVAMTDILSSNGEYLFMHSQVFDLEGKPLGYGGSDAIAGKKERNHLFTPTGFLDDSWFHRTYWLYGSTFNSGWNHWYDKGRIRPAGRLLVLCGSSVYGFGRRQEYFRWSTPLRYHIFSIDKNPALKPLGRNKKGRRRKHRAGYLSPTDWLKYNWSESIPIVVKAMIMADKTLFMAGPPEVINQERAWDSIGDPGYYPKLVRQEESLEGNMGSTLWSVSAENGKKRRICKIDSVPIYDGMAAARGKLFMAMADGSVRCFAGE